MPEPPFTLAYRKRRDWDDSWNPDWIPVPTVPGQNAFEGWEDMPESEFVYYRFRVDVDLVIGGRDFSAPLNPVLDFALAWQYLPRALDAERVVETSMSVQGLTYRVERDGDRVVVSSNDHPRRTSKEDFRPYRVSLAESEFGELVEHIVGGAFALLYEAHPRLRGNHYLNGLRERIGR
ncbi:hypothetical protein K3N28_13580 [Glycomyces sp. TRM65418]|uniref:hypothetical protein n=1 Tax=Glycomyces sp. TRM65418 TaxID=2867006 RepID=UPI001CE6E018|nr:hypothetical protein [Glycomyces sp. TRM65418]MCC3764097.1 hypothetical protein [Glycomyces sp. TRM65418]QZD53785.1 hypothetical protein K3N28_13515 [Glycomyces sp. TRM65418]